MYFYVLLGLKTEFTFSFLKFEIQNHFTVLLKALHCLIMKKVSLLILIYSPMVGRLKSLNQGSTLICQPLRLA